MDELMKMMAKKKMDGKMSPDEVQAKLDVIKELLGMADGHMGSQVKSGMDDMKKVSVIAPDSKSLEAGLTKAKDLVGSLPEESDDDKAVDEMDEDPKEEATETSEEEKAEDEAEASPADEAMASVDDSQDDDDMNPFNRKHKMMMAAKARS